MPSDPSTFSGLKTSLANWLNRDDLSTTEIPEAIALAEREFQRTLFAPEREASTTLTTSTESVSLPADFWGVRAVYLDASTDVVLERLTVSDLRDTYPTGSTGTPSHYAIQGETMLLAPVPSSSVSIKLLYIQTITALDDSNTTNWLLTDHPDVYLHGALSHLHTLLRDYEAANYHRTVLAGLVEQLGRSSRRRTINSGPLAATHSTRHIRNIRA